MQVNIPAESGEMGVLANHVPSIEQLKPGLIEVIEESGGTKQFFRKFVPAAAAVGHGQHIFMLVSGRPANLYHIEHHH